MSTFEINEEESGLMRKLCSSEVDRCDFEQCTFQLSPSELAGSLRRQYAAQNLLDKLKPIGIDLSDELDGVEGRPELN